MNKTIDELFQHVVKEAARDGVISQEEFGILKRLAELLGLEVKKANGLAAEIIKQFKAGELTFAADETPETLYRDLLLAFSDDHVIDGNEVDVLDQVKAWLGLQLPDSQEMPIVLGQSDSGDSQESSSGPILAENGDIQPLLCGVCKGQVPLVRKPEVKCPYCGAMKIIPNAYLEALASRTSFERHRKQAQELFKKLGTTPTAFEEALSEFNEQGLLVAFILSLGAVLAFVKALVFYPLDWFYSAFYALNMMDVISVYLPSILSTILTFFLSVVPFAILYWSRRKVLTLKHLKVALAATPPEKSGGPATCRSCGCPLEVSKNAIGITCTYCQTDNLLHVPSAWLKETKTTSIKIGRNAANAQGRFKKETMLGWESMLSVFLLFVIIGGINWWRVSSSQNSMVFQDEILWLTPYVDEIKSRTKIHWKKDQGPELPLDMWLEDAMSIDQFYVALAAGESLNLTWDIASTTIKSNNDDYGDLEITPFLVMGYSAGFMAQIEKASTPRKKPYFFKPRVGGWYKLKLFHDQMIQFRLKASISK